MTQTPPSVVRSYHPPLVFLPASSTPTEFELSGFTETGVMIFRGNICFAQIPPLWAESGPVTHHMCSYPAACAPTKFERPSPGGQVL
ncbi:hypothetical protein V3C99_003534 [Haemonchus contortus]